MKRFLLVIMAFLCITALSGCAGGTTNDKRIEKAVAMLKEHWTENYSEWSKVSDDTINDDWYLEIKNTRLVEIGETEEETLKNVAYVIEFIAYTNYYGFAPYYSYIPYHGSDVVILKDGSMQVSSNTIQTYISMHYESPPISAVYDYGSQYNAVYHLEEQ